MLLEKSLFTSNLCKPSEYPFHYMSTMDRFPRHTAILHSHSTLPSEHNKGFRSFNPQKTCSHVLILQMEGIKCVDNNAKDNYNSYG